MKFFHLFLSLFVCLFVYGCSTYQVRQIYVSYGSGESGVNYEKDGAQLRIGVVPNLRFSSFGMLGLPVIPFFAGNSNGGNLVMFVEIEYKQDTDFSFHSDPCIEMESSQPLCPYSASISVKALYQDDGSMYSDKRRRWNKIAAFYNLEDWLWEFPASGKNQAISKEEIYSHYGYVGCLGECYFKIKIKYMYDVNGEYPHKVKINSGGLVSVRGDYFPKQDVLLHRKRENDYQGLTNVQ